MNAYPVFLFAAFVVAVLGLAFLVVAVMIVADTITAWPSRPAHRRPRRSPGVQLWVRSVETDTAQLVITPEGRPVR